MVVTKAVKSVYRHSKSDSFTSAMNGVSRLLNTSAAMMFDNYCRFDTFSEDKSTLSLLVKEMTNDKVIQQYSQRVADAGDTSVAKDVYIPKRVRRYILDDSKWIDYCSKWENRLDEYKEELLRTLKSGVENEEDIDIGITEYVNMEVKDNHIYYIGKLSDGSLIRLPEAEVPDSPMKYNFRVQFIQGLMNDRQHFERTKQHATGNMFQCPKCKNTYKSKNSLGNHIRRVHKGK